MLGQHTAAMLGPAPMRLYGRCGSVCVCVCGSCTHLLLFEDDLVEIELQRLIGVIYTQLLETVKGQIL